MAHVKDPVADGLEQGEKPEPKDINHLPFQIPFG
jgi:hypothetical protein